MTRTEAIAIINATLPKLDDAQAAELAVVARSLVQAAPSLSDADRDGIARGKQDFKDGRTHSSAEARALTSAFLAKQRGVSLET